jgi:hypothetical protein
MSQERRAEWTGSTTTAHAADAEGTNGNGIAQQGLPADAASRDREAARLKRSA